MAALWRSGHALPRPAHAAEPRARRRGTVRAALAVARARRAGSGHHAAPAQDTGVPVSKMEETEANYQTSQPYSVAVIMPVIHYYMGGLVIDEDSLVVGTDSQPTRGDHAAGEVAGKMISGKKVNRNVISGADFVFCRFMRTFSW